VLAAAFIRQHDRQPAAHEVVRDLIDLAQSGGRQPGPRAGGHQRGVQRVGDAGLEGGVQVAQPQCFRGGRAVG
jgi:hypothetical protein